MSAIDIGPGATDRASTAAYGYTRVCIENPANDTGKITTFSFWFNTNGSGVKAGTFFGTAPNFTSRDVETIGDVTAGSEQQFSGLDCDVASGDYAGLYWSGGNIEKGTESTSYYKSGDQFGAGQQTYEEADPATTVSIYGTGVGENELTGWKSPGTCASAERSTGNEWLNPNNAQASDDAKTTSLDGNGIDPSDWLRCTNFGFTTDDIPADHYIIKIEFEIERRYSYAAPEGAHAIDDSIRLRTSVGQDGDDKADTETLWPISDAYAAYLWDYDEIGDLDGDDIRNSDFGVDISVLSSGLGENYAYIDHVRCRIYHSDVPPGVILLTGTIDAQSTVAGALSVARKIAGALEAQSGVTGALKVSRELTGAIASQSSVEGALKLSRELTGTVTGQSLIQGILSLGAEEALAGTITGQSTVEGDLKIDRKLTGTVAAQSGAQAALSQVMKLTGTIAAQSSVSGMLDIGEVFLSGVIAAMSTTEGKLTMERLLTGEVAAKAEVEGVLTVPGPGQRQAGMFLVM